jgi:crossover junction endodeoxyribonuclease RuvC
MQHYAVLDVGVVKVSPSLPLNQRIADLHSAIFDLLHTWKPDCLVMETPFFGKNAQSALKLGHARGAFIAAASRHHIPTAEVSPTHVKRIICGHGHASKEQISQTVRRLLGLNPQQRLSFDATDALAIACAAALQGVGSAPPMQKMAYKLQNTDPS